MRPPGQLEEEKGRETLLCVLLEQFFLAESKCHKADVTELGGNILGPRIITSRPLSGIRNYTRKVWGCLYKPVRGAYHSPPRLSLLCFRGKSEVKTLFPLGPSATTTTLFLFPLLPPKGTTLTTYAAAVCLPGCWRGSAIFHRQRCWLLELLETLFIPSNKDMCRTILRAKKNSL